VAARIPLHAPEEVRLFERPADVAVLESTMDLALDEPARPESARIVSYLPNRVEIETDVAAPGVLVLTDMYYPGWICTIDGRDELVFPVDHIFRGVRVRPGDRSVVFTYAPASFRNGAIVTTAGVVIAIAWFAAALAIRSRRQTSAADVTRRS
jgi:uncharacterized membrane protein YfhO